MPFMLFIRVLIISTLSLYACAVDVVSLIKLAYLLFSRQFYSMIVALQLHVHKCVSPVLFKIVLLLYTVAQSITRLIGKMIKFIKLFWLNYK